MRRTCFVCYSDDGKKDSLTYHEISRKTEGDEFFVFLSWARSEDEVPLRDLYRKVVSSSRLGHPARFFRELAESTVAAAKVSRDDSWLERSGILIVWKRGEETFLFRNKGIEPVHFDHVTGLEGSIRSLEDAVEIILHRETGQADLFDRQYGDLFTLDQFRMSAGGHTLLFAPTKDFIRRNREALLDSVLFPSFDVPVSGELEVDTDRSLGAMHWGRGETFSDLPERKKRSVEIMKSSVPMAAGAVALVIAILIIFNPFGKNGDETSGGEEILLAPAGNTDNGDIPAGEEESSVEEVTADSDAGDPDLPDAVENTKPGASVVLTEGWRKKFDKAVTSSPVVCGDNVTFGCRDGNLYCFSIDGKIKWKYEAAMGVGSTPACSGDRVVGADYEGNVFCLEMEDGKMVWNYRSGAKIVSGPRISNGNVLVSTMDGRIISLGFDSGERNWSQKIGEQVWATPAVGKDYIVVATTDGSLVRMTHDGKIVWRVAPGGSLHSSPLCLEDEDLVVLGTGDRYLIGYSLSGGMLMWRYGAGSEVRSSPVSSGGRIVVGTEDGILIALDKNGQLLWKKDLGGAIRSKPLILGEMIAVTSYNAKLYILSMSDGSISAEYRADAPIYSSPAYHDGRVFFGSNGGFIHAPAISMTGG